ncbi:DUF2057 family protein [Vibrio fluvialis]|nr:DUF2057 family protein [Vibrio fluvialis]MBY7974628.1 DUF2057 family protein [Vibrio fluvialis]MBY7996601.1 DUF2057 family protein [Vibrio fluvialis]MBY8103862.1 DUF2057 family protein [Vibrio fluvialis]
MKLLKLGLVSAMALNCLSAWADVQLNIAEDVNLIAVNGLKPDLGDTLIGKDHVTLPNGVNQIVFKYEPKVEDNDTLRTVYSDIKIVKFTAEDTNVYFVLPKYKHLSKAKKDIKDFSWSLVDSDGTELSLQQDEIKSSGIQLGRNYLQDVMDYNQKGGIAAIPVGVVYASPKVLPLDKPSVQIADTENVAQLKLWYSKSTPEERKAFRKWVVDQD